MEYTRTDQAPAPTGAYEQATIHNGVVYTSMQLPQPPGGNNPGLQSIEEQMEMVIGNIRAVLEASGSSLDRVLRATIYIRDEHMHRRVSMVFEKYFTGHKPALSIVGVTAIPLGYGVAMDVIAACR